MRMKMKNNNALIGTAMLMAIWDKTHQDNLDLLKPFVLYLIGKNTHIGEEINIDSIIIGMEKEFGFSNIPRAVIIKIFGRMKKLVLRKNNCFYLLKDVIAYYNDFNNKKRQIADDSERVITQLTEYLRNINSSFNKITMDDTKSLFCIFLEKNGFLTIDNIENLRNISDYKIEQTNYYIGQFILNENEKGTSIFESIYNIVCGFMLANVIYMQVDNSNNASLKNVNFYIDTPLILNILGYKTEEKNNSATILIDLLKQKQGILKCFENNYNELYSIIYAYKENIGRFNEKTLEGLDILNYTETDVELILNNLKDILLKKEIKIEEMPNYEINPGIDELELEKYLKEKYEEKDEKNEKRIRIDVESISAISRLRAGKIFSKLEECKAIFVTTNYELVKSSTIFLNKKPFEQIGYVISDVELTTFLWLKNFRTNPDLPKFKLIENARLSMQPNPVIMERFKDALEKLNSMGLINEVDEFENLRTSYYYKSELMQKIGADRDKINPEIVRGIIDKKSENLESRLNVANERIRKLEREKEESENDRREARISIEEGCKKKATKISKTIINSLNFGLNVVLYTFLCISVFYTTLDILGNKQITNISAVVSLLVSIVGILDMIFPRMNYIKKWLMKKQENIREYLNYRLIKKEREMRKDLYRINR